MNLQFFNKFWSLGIIRTESDRGVILNTDLKPLEETGCHKTSE